MKDFSKLSCRTKKGLLFLRDCAEIASAWCGRCGRPICSRHQMMVESLLACPECAAALEREEPQDSEYSTGWEDVREEVYDRLADTPQAALNTTQERNRLYVEFGYIPFFYGSHHYYSDSDFQTFDNRFIDHDPKDGPIMAQAGQTAKDDTGDELES
ncbi:MAG: hypothetical protein HQK57_12885 [Deltaproteobacteria bacterium]|nr:hypothetical protein [Deltaproteobacteria bacterium]